MLKSLDGLLSLIKFSHSHSEAEYADHVTVYNLTKEVLIDAADFCFNQFHVSQSINPDVLDALRLKSPAAPKLVRDVYGF